MRIFNVICVGSVFFITLSSAISGYEETKDVAIAPARAVSLEVAQFSRDEITGKSASITNGALQYFGSIIGVRRKREIVKNDAERTKGRRNRKKRKNYTQVEGDRERSRERERNGKRKIAERYKDRKKGRKGEPLTRHARRPQRRRTRKPRKEAGANGTRSRQRNHERRNLEKQYLVRNRTLELLEKKTTDAANRSAFIYPVNNVREVLFERRITPEKIGQILGEGRTAPSIRIADLLIPKTDLEAVESKKNVAKIEADEKSISTYNGKTRNEEMDEPPLFLGKFKSIAMNVSRMNKAVEILKEDKPGAEISAGEIDFEENSYRYDYEDIFGDPSVSPWVNPPRGKEAISGREDKEYYLDTALPSSVYMPIDDQNTVHQGLASLLTRLFQTLRNTTDKDNKELLQDLDFDNSVQGDLCQKWLDCKDKLEEAFLGPLVLPACPCHYPSSIFYDDKIWDEGQQRYFRWRDVSGEAERLDVYKLGATYCIRSLLAQGGGSAAAQHCCYDGKRRLLTRGSGAGTPNFVSPEVSAVLHERLDVLPWRLCKGDFSRFNKVRPPNNENHCKENPDEDEYQRQMDATKHY